MQATPTAIITGGAGGMGLATAKVMGRDHRVLVADVDPARLEAAAAELAALGIAADPVVCDVADRGSVDSLFARANDAGGLRAVVHTAGVSPLMGSAPAIVRINALGTVLVARAALAVATQGFALVNVASIAGHLVPSLLVPRRIYRLALTDPGRFAARLAARADRGPRSLRSGSAYSLSKNFVVWYTQRIAADFGARGARVVSVSPGSFDTAMGRLEEKSGSARLLDYAALARFGTPEEIAELLAFCASTRAGYLTGADILCDGGTRAGLGLRGMIALARRA